MNWIILLLCSIELSVWYINNDITMTSIFLYLGYEQGPSLTTSNILLHQHDIGLISVFLLDLHLPVNEQFNSVFLIESLLMRIIWFVELLENELTVASLSWHPGESSGRHSFYPTLQFRILRLKIEYSVQCSKIPAAWRIEYHCNADLWIMLCCPIA